MVPVVLVQPGWLMVVAATEVGWAIPTLAYGTGRALMAGTGRTLAYGLPWHGMAGSQAATEVLGQSARASQVLASF